MRLAILLLIVCAGALFEPDCFRFLARIFISAEAWRAGVSTHIGGVEGSVLEPLTLRDTVWIYESGTGPVTRVEIQSATADFAWRNLLPRSTGHVFQQLTLRGVTGKIQFPLTATTAVPRPAERFHLPRPTGTWLAAPDRIEAHDVDFVFQSNADFVQLADANFTLSSVEPGIIRAGQILVKQPWVNRTFRDVHGTTAIQESKVEIANLTLDPAVQIQSFSAELDDLARGRLNLEMDVAAFGGKIRVAADTLSEERPLNFEATGTFSQISLAKLAGFLGSTAAAGGTIKEGKFTFRGPPQQIASATASLRFEATNFQWDSRQWDSLVLGATLMNGRVQVPELALAQGHNRLNLSGEMPLPAPGVEWWQTEFDLNIAAKIENLTELSALMMPEFQYAAGKADINGSVRGKDQQFHGQLLVSGSNLRWHNAPIDELHAGVTLNGNEFQITNVSIFNNGDYLRGHGVVNIIGDKQYWGEFHASIEDLAKYSAILQKPVVPEPLAGGAVIDWSGEGSAKGHSGQFSARLAKLRSLGATAALLHPVNADFEGGYAPGMMQFSRFMVADDDSSFTANVGIGNKALSLQGIRLIHKQALWLEGDALLPLDVWNAWPNTTLATLLDDQTVSKVNLTAYDLQMRDTSLLTGWKFPIEGLVRGNLVAEGALGSLKSSGKFTISKAQIPIGWSGEFFKAVEGEATLDGQILHVTKLAGLHPHGDFAASGDVDFTHFRDPTLRLEITSAKSEVEIFRHALPTPSGIFSLPCGVTASAKLRLSGPASGPTVSGDVQVSSLQLGGALTDIRSVLFLDNQVEPLPAVLAPGEIPWANLQFDLQVKTPDSKPIGVKFGHGSQDDIIELELRLTGSASDPIFVGEAILGMPPSEIFNTWTGVNPLSDMVGTARLDLIHAAFSFRAGFAADPSITAEASGVTLGEKFTMEVVGTLLHPIRFFMFQPPLTERLIRAALAAGDIHNLPPEEAPLHLRVRPELFEGVDVVDWAPIAPAPSEPGSDATPAPPPSPAPPAQPVPVIPPPGTAPAPTPTIPASAPATPSPPQ